MTSFKALPNKRAVSGDESVENLWPELGDEIELNQFYNRYDGAEGWLGEGYLAIWTRQEIEDFQGQNLQAYPTTYRFFASLMCLHQTLAEKKMCAFWGIGRNF